MNSINFYEILQRKYCTGTYSNNYVMDMVISLHILATSPFVSGVYYKLFWI